MISKKTLTITAIVSVAVIMGMSAVVPMIPQAEATPIIACEGILKAAEAVEAAGKTVEGQFAVLVEHCKIHELPV